MCSGGMGGIANINVVKGSCQVWNLNIASDRSTRLTTLFKVVVFAYSPNILLLARMGLFNLNPLCKFLIRQTLPVTRCRHQKLSVLAQKIEHTTRPRQEYFPIQHEQTLDPYALVASELVHIRKSMLTMLDTAHPGLVDRKSTRLNSSHRR